MIRQMDMGYLLTLLMHGTKVNGWRICNMDLERKDGKTVPQGIAGISLKERKMGEGDSIGKMAATMTDSLLTASFKAKGHITSLILTKLIKVNSE